MSEVPKRDFEQSGEKERLAEGLKEITKNFSEELKIQGIDFAIFDPNSICVYKRFLDKVADDLKNIFLKKLIESKKMLLQNF